MAYNLGDVVYVRSWKDHGKHRIVRIYENYNKQNTYTIDDFHLSTWQEDALICVQENHHPKKYFKNELELGDVVLSSVNHVRTYGKIISKIYTINSTRIQYVLDNGHQFYGSQLRQCEGGV